MEQGGRLKSGRRLLRSGDINLPIPTPMRILAAIHPPTTTQAILRSLGLPTRAPPVAPARPVSPDWTLSEPVVGLAGYFTRPAA